MTLCIGFIGAVVVLEAGPVYNIFMSGVRRVGLNYFQWIWLVGSFSFVLALCVTAMVIPMRLGEKRMAENL
jgi:ABC-2 type transport system permease protein